jgi:hypothetical protein
MRKRHPGGRPPKFMEPSGPVTVTLPIRTLEQLRGIDADRAKAIVKAVDSAVGNETASLGADVIEMAPGTGVVVVRPNRSLRSLPWLKMIEVAPMRHLLAITPGTPIEKVEVGLIDLIENAKDSAPEDLPMLETLVKKVRHLRRQQQISVAEILFVAL